MTSPFDGKNSDLGGDRLKLRFFGRLDSETLSFKPNRKSLVSLMSLAHRFLSAKTLKFSEVPEVKQPVRLLHI